MHAKANKHQVYEQQQQPQPAVRLRCPAASIPPFIALLTAPQAQRLPKCRQQAYLPTYLLTIPYLYLPLPFLTLHRRYNAYRAPCAESLLPLTITA